jgi:hypothetical protein
MVIHQAAVHPQLSGHLWLVLHGQPLFRIERMGWISEDVAPGPPMIHNRLILGK